VGWQGLVWRDSEFVRGTREYKYYLPGGAGPIWSGYHSAAAFFSR
jgi:hypothetical protein